MQMAKTFPRRRQNSEHAKRSTRRASYLCVEVNRAGASSTPVTAPSTPLIVEHIGECTRINGREGVCCFTVCNDVTGMGEEVVMVLDR